MNNRWHIGGAIIILLLGGCDNNKKEQALTEEQLQQQQKLIDQQLANMRFIKGGSFNMGGGSSKDQIPLHKVTLDSFSLSRFKVTLGDYLLYRQLTGKPENPYPDEIKDNEDMKQDKKSWSVAILYQLNNHPVTAPWSEARGYCLWLGEKAGLPIDLPTEAQWEYAARVYGNFGFATDTLDIDHGFNVPIPMQSKVSVLIEKGGTFPIGSFPPNRLGLYDMAGTGAEWMFDWYDSQYYADSPENNPKGPEKGEKISFSTFRLKNLEYQAHSLRNFSLLMFTSGAASNRSNAPDTPYNNQLGYMWEMTFRCAINQPEAVN